MLPHLPPWVEVTFPGVVATVMGLSGAFIVRRRARGELIVLYGGLALLACWASFGPAAGLYSALYRVVPLFAWLRAPGRFGLLVVFALSALASIAASALNRRAGGPWPSVALAVVACLELAVPSPFRTVEPFEPVYRTLATLPRGPVIEMPFYYIRGMYPLHTRYMLNSTTHWMPLVNGYSDYIPPDFDEKVETLKFMPSDAGLRMLDAMRVRYVVFHLYGYNEQNRRDVFTRMGPLQQYLRPLYRDDATLLYEIVGAPR